MLPASRCEPVGLVALWSLDVSTTPIPAGPRAFYVRPGTAPVSPRTAKSRFRNPRPACEPRAVIDPPASEQPLLLVRRRRLHRASRRGGSRTTCEHPRGQKRSVGRFRPSSRVRTFPQECPAAELATSAQGIRSPVTFRPPTQASPRTRIHSNQATAGSRPGRETLDTLQDCEARGGPERDRPARPT